MEISGLKDISSFLLSVTCLYDSQVISLYNDPLSNYFLSLFHSLQSRDCYFIVYKVYIVIS